MNNPLEIGHLLAIKRDEAAERALELAITGLEKLASEVVVVKQCDVTPGQMVVVQAHSACDGYRLDRLNVIRHYGEAGGDTHRITLRCGDTGSEVDFIGAIPHHEADGSLEGRAWSVISSLCDSAVAAAFAAVRDMAPAP